MKQFIRLPEGPLIAIDHITKIYWSGGIYTGRCKIASVTEEEYATTATVAQVLNAISFSNNPSNYDLTVFDVNTKETV